MRTKLKSSLKKTKRRYVFIAAFMLFGIATLIYTRAASPTAHFEAESGTRTANATTALDSNASNGQYLKFSSTGGTFSCVAPNFPDASCTGVPAGTTLSIYNGDLFTSSNSQIIENREVRGGTIVCQHANVTIRNSKTVGQVGGIYVDPSCTGLRVNDVEIDCQSKNGTSGFSQGNGFVGQNIELRRLNVHHCENGVFIDNGVKLYDSYIHHGVPYDPILDPHTDGVQTWGSASDVVVEGNFVDMSSTPVNAAFTSTCDADVTATPHDLYVNRNRFLGGGYTMYLPNELRPGCTWNASNMKFTNNRLAGWEYGSCSGNTTAFTWTGNVNDSSGVTITNC